MASGKAQQPAQPSGATERVNVALGPDAGAALDKLQERTGLAKAGLVNQALKLFEFIDTGIRAGGTLIIRDEEGEESRVKLLY